MPPSSKLPIIAIVGRPNVGKSTLFNRYSGHRRVLVEDQPGVTRDTIAEEVDVDGRRVLLVDTAGLDPQVGDRLSGAVQAHARAAMQEARQTAVSLGPDVERHAQAATRQLEKTNMAGALPEPRQALELLKEIAESLAQPPDENSQQQQDPQQGEQDQQEQSKQGEQNQQQGSSPPQDTSQPSQDPARSPQEIALSTLRRARESERQHRDLRQQLQRAAARRVPVYRDW